jgi:hypothetical protein
MPNTFQDIQLFTYRPGGVTDPPNNIYATWLALMTAIGAAPVGAKSILFDDSVTTPCTIPAGTYDMTNISWGRAPTANDPVAIALAEGDVFTNLRQFLGDLQVTFTGTTPPFSDLTSGNIVIFQGAVRLSSTNGPLFQISVAGGRPVVFQMDFGSWIAAGGAVLNMAAAGSSAIVIGDAFNSRLDAGTITGVMGSFIILVSQIVGVNIINLGIGNISTSQPNFAGTLGPNPNPPPINNVPTGSVQTISPGTQLQFSGEMTVHGEIIIRGTGELIGIN